MIFAMYEIKTDRRRKLLSVTLNGLWNLEVLEQYERDMKTALASLGCKPGEHLILADFRNHAVQSKDVVARVQAMFDTPLLASRRTALIVSGALAKMQQSRIIKRDDERIFSSEEEAIQWLISPADWQGPDSGKPVDAVVQSRA
jgi:hypothetical protein